MPYSRSEAVKRAKASTTYAVGMCLQWTRKQFGVAALGDFDGDGDADAVDAWRAAQHKHAGDTNPPAGVPVFWGKGHGHAAVSIGGGKVRSTDWPKAGKVGTANIADITRKWGLPYLGWTEDLYGHVIADDAPKPDRDRPLRVLLRSAEKEARRRKRIPLADRLRARRVALRPKK